MGGECNTMGKGQVYTRFR